MRGRALWLWVVVGAMATLGARCDCGGCVTTDFGFGLGGEVGKHGRECAMSGCGGGVAVCQDSLECCVTGETRGTGTARCANADECVLGALDDPCDPWADEPACEAPYGCEGTDGVCGCVNECKFPAIFRCELDETTCAAVCCEVPCSDGGTCSRSSPDGGPFDGGPDGDAADGGESDADGADGSLDDAGEGADAEPADGAGDALDAGNTVDDAGVFDA